MVGLCNVTKITYPVIGHFIYSSGLLRYIGSRWHKLTYIIQCTFDNLPH